MIRVFQLALLSMLTGLFIINQNSQTSWQLVLLPLLMISNRLSKSISRLVIATNVNIWEQDILVF
ncbi:MAG: hypothetical protein QG641_2984 [Candidatus Poribacteria bacterium]|nr:hypothetical protein [Candidatus Poribacteria bacterium]